MEIVTYDQAVRNRRKHTLSNGTTYWKSEYLQLENVIQGEYPQCFLVEQAPNSTIRPHFHRVDQFQVIVKGEGKFGSQDVRPITVQYADGYKPYGPIIAEEKSLHYFTIRAETDYGANFMPEQRDILKKGKKNSYLVKNLDLIPNLLQQPQPVQTTLIPSLENGLAAYKLTLGSNQQQECPPAKNTNGQYILIINGSAIFNHKKLGNLTSIFVHPSDNSFTLRSTIEGTEALVLNFPKKR